MAGSVLKNLQMFARLCGQKAMPSVVLVTTMWCGVDSETGTRRENQLMDGFWTEMVTNGCRVERFDNTYKSAWCIIGGLAEKRTADMLLPREMVDLKMRLNETQAGVTLSKQLEKLLKDQRDAARMLEKQTEKMGNDVIALNPLKERKAQIEENIDKVADQLRILRVPFNRKVRLFFSRKLN